MSRRKWVPAFLAGIFFVFACFAIMFDPMHLLSSLAGGYGIACLTLAIYDALRSKMGVNRDKS